MAADQALALPRISRAVKAFVGLLSHPEAQPEFRNLQVPLTAQVTCQQGHGQSLHI